MNHRLANSWKQFDDSTQNYANSVRAVFHADEKLSNSEKKMGKHLRGKEHKLFVILIFRPASFRLFVVRKCPDEVHIYHRIASG